MTKRSKTTPASGKPSIVFFGNEKLVTGGNSAKPIIREALVSAGFEIEKVITGKLSELGRHKSTLAVLAAYGRIIPQRILDEFPLGIINVHPSLLPKYRGPTPIESAILDGATETGVSIMKLTAGMDEGPVYKQKTLRLTGRESKHELAEASQKLGAELLVEILSDIASGELQPRQQSHPDRATYSRKLTKEDGVLDFTKPAEVLEREIRAFIEWPKSRTNIAGKDVIVIKAHAVPSQPADSKPGDTTVVKEAGVIMIATGNGSLCIERLKPAGKNEMSANAFIAGYGKGLEKD